MTPKTKSYWVTLGVYVALMATLEWSNNTDAPVVYIATMILTTVLYVIATANIGSSACQRTALAEAAIHKQRLLNGQWCCLPNHKGATVTYYWVDVPELSLVLGYDFKLYLQESEVPATPGNIDLFRTEYLAEKAHLSQTEVDKP